MQSSHPMCHKRTVLSAEDDNKYCTDYFILNLMGENAVRKFKY